MKICGTHKFSILQLSEILKSLRLTHLVYRSHSGESNLGLKERVGEGKAPILVADGLSSIRKKKGLIIVSAPLAELQSTNIPKLAGEDLVSEIEEAMEMEDIELKIKPPSIMHYVNTAVKPSFLMGVQTTLYQIPNPAVRKAAQTAVIQFLDTSLGLAALCKMLKSNLTTEPLIPLVNSPTSLALREAVARYRKGEDILQIEAETKFMSFDILYIARSSDLHRKTKQC